MSKIKILYLVVAALLALQATLAVAQSRTRKKPSKSYNKPNQNRELIKRKRLDEKNLAEDVEIEPPSPFFPDWPTPSFNYGASPIIGMKYQVDADETSTSRTFQSEIGLMGYISGIGLWPGNPGLYLRPEVGYVWGRVDGEVETKGQPQPTQIDDTYQRSWGGLTFTIPVYFYRHETQVYIGRKLFNKATDSDLYSFTLVNDFGFLVLPWLSAHYTHTLLQAMHKEFSADPFSEEQDHWLHVKFSPGFLNFYADLGPGFTIINQTFNQDTDAEREITGKVDYLLLKTGLNPFWKFYASGYAKYVYDSDQKEIGSNAGTRLPDQSLYDAPIVAMPEDSLYASVVFGVDRLIGGLGIGWRYNIQILNMSEKNNTERKRTEDNGLILSYSLAL